MGEQCNVLYNDTMEPSIRRSLKAALISGNTTQFIESLNFYNKGNTVVRLKPNGSDTESEAILSVRNLYNTIERVLMDWDIKHPSSQQTNKVLPEIMKALNIMDDSSEVVLNTDNIEIKTKAEELDQNTANLSEHFAEFYGNEAYNIISTIKQNFSDMITGAAYYDANSGMIVDQTVGTLNNNIKREKARLFQSLVNYMKSTIQDESVQKLSDTLYVDGKMDALNYCNALRLFYAKVAHKPDFKSKVTRDYTAVTQELKRERTETYQNYVQELLNTDTNFGTAMSETFPGMKFSNFKTQLYQADHLSEYYTEVKNYLTKTNSPILEEFVKLEEKPNTLATAAAAYTTIVHFDSLLKDTYGDHVSILEGTSGYEMDIDNKYYYHQDTTHEKKGWQTSESVGSEKHTAKFTNAILNSIRLYNYKTGEYQNHRLTPTEIIFAARRLLEGISTGSITFQINSTSQKKAVQALKKHVASFMDSPDSHMRDILKLLFKPYKGSQTPLINNILKNGANIYDNDLSVLKSLYDIVFDDDSKISFYRQSLRGNRNATSLIHEIVGFINRNAIIHYMETSYEFGTGKAVIETKRMYFNNIQLRKLQTEINSYVNKGITKEDRESIQKDYKFSETPNGSTINYSVNIGGTKVTLGVSTGYASQILDKYREGSPMKFVESEAFFKRLSEVNIPAFQQKMELVKQGRGSIVNVQFDQNEQTLYDTLKFLDRTLNMHILDGSSLDLQTLGSYKELFVNADGFTHYMQPLLKLGIRAAYINSKYYALNKNRSGITNLKSFLYNEQDPLYSKYSNSSKLKGFNSTFNKLQYVAASFDDSVLKVWADARSILMGESSKSTTKDKQGNSLPNNSVGKLGVNLNYYLDKQIGTNVGSLLFVQNPNSIKRVFHDLEVTTKTGDSKNVKDFSSGELAYHSIFNKFWGSYTQSGTIVVQPTTYSDKTTFLNWEVNPEFNGVNIMRESSDATLNLYTSTIGVAYARIRNTTVEKLKAIAKKYTELCQEPYDDQNLDNILHKISPNAFVGIAASLNLEVEKNKDYRIIKDANGKKVVSMNGLLDYNTLLYNSPELLKDRLSKEKNIFLDQLLQMGSKYQVLEGADTLDMYTQKEISDKARSHNPILQAIYSYTKDKGVNGRIDYMNNWVDGSTGRLILAKQNGNNISSYGDSYDHNAPVELNPLLDKFFMVEGLVSNNLRYSLTGFEINHPIGKKPPFSQMQAAETPDRLQSILGTNTPIDQSTFDTVKNILSGCLDAHDLQNQYILQNNNLSPEAKSLLLSCLEKEFIYETNTAQGTQFKRNVIIPATLQYCTLNTQEGIPNSIRCAVIDDESAPVYNYRGSHEGSIDACDGAAKITPFQCIMENRCLDSQAVGFTKKPIWHSYDTSGGTAFLAKFATNTMTNEEMRTSLMSHTSMYNLFRKATDIQWDTNIDLTQSITMQTLAANNDGTDLSPDYWFKKVILRDGSLFYKDKYGINKEIIGFGKESLPSKEDGSTPGIDVYYTEEKTAKGKPTRKYHLFYNKKGQGIVHITANSVESASAKYDQLIAKDSSCNPHSINSLFELHTALGGIYCTDSSGNYSEFNNEVVVNFMNEVGEIQDPSDKEDYSSKLEYYQPLKMFHIGYLFNSTAVKNGAKNVNPSSSWYDNKPLTTFFVDAAGLGMQMNADHDIVGSELTEFSQVIAATSAYGYLSDQNYDLFYGLAKSAFQESKQILTATDNFISNLNSENAKSDLYDAIGRIILLNQSIKDKESLTNVIMGAVQKVFDKYNNHLDDDSKIPFSDPNIYSGFISTLASTITKQSIKRSHPGSGCVMVPGYNIIQYFEIPTADGKVEKLMSDDILQRARQEYKNDLVKFVKSKNLGESIEKAPESMSVSALESIIRTNNFKIDFTPYYNSSADPTVVNKHMIETYLKKFTNAYKDKSYFMPSDIVEVVDPDTNTIVETVNLDTMDKYYAFKKGIGTNGTLYSPQFRYRISVKSPHNLRPSLIRWQYKTSPDYNPEYEANPFITEAVDPNIVDVSIMAAANSKNTMAKISLKGQSDQPGSYGYIELTKDEFGGYSIHYNPNLDSTGKSQGNTKEQLVTLYKQVRKLIPDGARISIRGNITKNDLSVLKGICGKWIRLPETRRVTNTSNGFQSEDAPIFMKGSYSYMNAFDLPAIANAYANNTSEDPDTRKAVQDALHLLQEEGKFYDANGELHPIIDGTLENQEAELVMSNIYKDTFGVGNESLAEILSKGEKYFSEDSSKLKPPVNTLYDIAFLRGNGKHVYVTTDNVDLNTNISDKPFTNVVTNEDGDITIVKHGRELFKIGVWADSTDKNITYNESTGKFESNSDQEVDQTLYRYGDGNIQKKHIFIKRYNMASIKTTAKGPVYLSDTLYKIADAEEISKALGISHEDAINYQAELIKQLYGADNYKMAQLNLAKEMNKDKYQTYSSTLKMMMTDEDLEPEAREVLEVQLANMSKNVTSRAELLEAAKKKLIQAEAHKKWVSFQDSLKFISSRIPAQTLQSFMAMKLVAWTGNSKNMCYVSHFQTYLQGSDYDIDKAYIMGQNYDSNATYVKWSPLFDYSSVKTLEASKALPVPKGLDIHMDYNYGADISEEIAAIMSVTSLDSQGAFNIKDLPEYSKVKYLKAMTSAIRKVEKANGGISKMGNNSNINNAIFKLLSQHEKYVPASEVATEAFKNVASANIYAVSHDIRNRDQAYTAIAIALMRSAADKSPKGEQASTLNMLNPLTKYIMQYQNLVGKNVIGIAANGEKFWFNVYSYWTQVLKSGNENDIANLKFSRTTNRIKGRAKYLKSGNPQDLEANTVTHLPDLNIRDQKIKDILINEFDATPDSLIYKYVDQELSQLLSVATDNAKELVLAKINAGTNFAKMYVYLISMGYDLDDIAAFMVSPVAELIDNRSMVNCFQESGINPMKVQNSIEEASGYTRSKHFLHGLTFRRGGYDTDSDAYIEAQLENSIGDFEGEGFSTESKVRTKITDVRDAIYIGLRNNYPELSKNFYSDLAEYNNEKDDIQLNRLMQKIILTSATLDTPLDIVKLVQDADLMVDPEVITYLRYCQDLALQLHNIRKSYTGIQFDPSTMTAQSYAELQLNELLADAQEFSNVYNLASEISDVTTGYLGLNQGLPTDKASLIKKLNQLKKPISSREKVLGIDRKKLFHKDKIRSQQVLLDLWEKLENKNITSAELEDILNRAYKADIINNFDSIKMLTDEEYRKTATEYLNAIKGTVNILDVVEKIPHYKETMNCLKALVTSDMALSAKSRGLHALMADTKSLTEKQIRDMVNYVDQINILDFLSTECAPVVTHRDVEGFNALFDKISTSHFDMSTPEGMSGFKKFMETDFLTYLKLNYANNPLVPHLRVTTIDSKTALATDIDLMSPNTTDSTKKSYEDILSGMALFENQYYEKSGYTITDLFQLYNLIVNRNQYGGERLTTAFKACSNKDSVLERFLKFESSRDYNSNWVADYNRRDFLINIAPKVSANSERFHTEPYIRVADPVWGYVLKKYDSKTNQYFEESIYPSLTDKESSYETKLERRTNLEEWCPFIMPARFKDLVRASVLNFSAENVTEAIRAEVKALLHDMSISNTLQILKICK